MTPASCLSQYYGAIAHSWYAVGQLLTVPSLPSYYFMVDMCMSRVHCFVAPLLNVPVEVH